MMTGFERYTKKTRRAMFLEEMEEVVPWAKLCGLIESHYPKPGKGRRAEGTGADAADLFFLQAVVQSGGPRRWKEALYDSATLRQFRRD